MATKTTPKTPATTPVDPFAAIAQPKKPAAKKSKVPMVEAPGLAAEIKDWLEADAALKNAEAKKAAAEALILPHAEDERLSRSFEAQECLASVRLTCPAGTVTVTQKNQYTACAPEALPELKTIFGDDYPRFFVEERSITVKKSADLKVLAALVGPDRLAEFFDVATVAKVTPAFHVERSTDPKLQKKAAPALGSLVRPYKAAVVAYAKDSDD